jgi:hypothetical protein
MLHSDGLLLSYVLSVGVPLALLHHRCAACACQRRTAAPRQACFDVCLAPLLTLLLTDVLIVPVSDRLLLSDGLLVAVTLPLTLLSAIDFCSATDRLFVSNCRSR